MALGYRETLAAGLLVLATSVQAQVIGSSDNFDCFNDTGTEAEGFEIDIEDVVLSDLTREFPSNFSSTPWVIRYGLPTVTAYDFRKATPDAEHTYDAGHQGVHVTWAATWNGSKWVARYGSQPFGKGVAGNGTPYIAHPTFTNGDSCWFYGLGAAYPTSGCDHFGISFAPTAAPGRIYYHWKIPNPSKPGALMNAGLEASIPPSPVLTPNPANPAAAVRAVAEAPENPEPRFGPAYWVRVTTLYSPVRAQLDDLQKANIKKANATKTVSWKLLQRPPAGQKGEREDAEDDAVAAGNVAVLKQYEYYAFGGAYDNETHEALCETASTQANLVNGVFLQGGDCLTPLAGNYWVVNVDSNQEVVGGNLGVYIGAHVNAYNLK